ncbi:MAG: UDP-N-acetylmuramoyl-tripeptide--D-alanyl-D-alanine ligase [Pseudomonadota bacterium]
MSPLWTAADAAAATGGTAQGDWAATSLSIDSREIDTGALFIALKDQRDGHDFVADALGKGAAAALVSRVPEGVPDNAPLLIVPDVQAGLEALGRVGRARTRAKVIAVTGSVGKTSTKEMLRTMLGAQGHVHAAERSFNNHWGVPLTLARCPAMADYAVIEIGMNHPGEIAPLAAMAAPHVAMVTTVAPAHLEAFENLTGIAREKASIFTGLVAGGTAVLNADLDTTPILRGVADAQGVRVWPFGTGQDCIGRLVTCALHADGVELLAQIGGETVMVTLQAPGRHLAMNAVGALTAAAAAGAGIGASAAALADWLPPEGRGTREVVRLAGGASFELVDDSYNANPTSLAAALEVLAAAAPAGRRVAIVGDMLELGPEEAALHAGIADLPSVAALDLVHCVGPRAQALMAALPQAKRGRWAARAKDMAEDAPALVADGDLVLVKGSNGSRVSEVASALRRLAAAPGTH